MYPVLYSASEDVPVDATTFPDPVFRAWAISTVGSGSTTLTPTMRNKISVVDLSNKGITSLEGIQYFPRLYKLTCTKNSLTMLDLSNNPLMLNLYCGENQISSLNLSGLTELQELNIADNAITSLDLSTNPGLLYVVATDNELTTIDVSKQMQMSLFYCSVNHITALDLSKNSALATLVKDENARDVVATKPTGTWQIDMKDYAGSGNLGKVTMNSSAGLASYDSATGIATLNGNEGDMVPITYSYNTGLSKSGMSTFAVTLNVSIPGASTTHAVTFNTAGGSPQPDAQAVTANGFAQKPAVDPIKSGFTFGGWHTASNTSFDFEKTPIISDIELVATWSANGNIPINETLFPDADFRAYVKMSLANNKSYLTPADIAAATVIKLPAISHATTLQGIEYFTELTTLECKNQELTSLDVSANIKLTRLVCIGNNLATLDVTMLPKLETLDFRENALTSIDVTKNAALRSFNCGNNPDFSTIDVTKNPALEQVFCFSTALTVLDLSKNSQLDWLSCSDTNLLSLDITNNPEIMSLYCNNTQITALDLSNNKKIDAIECYGNKNLTSLDTSMIPVLRKLSCYESNLLSLKLPQGNSLTQLLCYKNSLAKLDVSGCAGLEYLQCQTNSIKEIDVTGCPDLVQLVVTNNELTSIDVSHNALLSQLYCGGNQIAALDTTNNTKLTMFNTTPNNVRTATASLVDGAWQAALGPLVGTGNTGNVSLSSSTGIETFDPATGLIVFSEGVTFPFLVEYQYTTASGGSRSLPVSLTISKQAGVTHSVTFDADGGTPEPATQTIDNGAKATQPADPAKAGFVFDGWFAAGSTTAWDFGTAITADVALTAQWATVTHSVTFDADGGTPTPAAQTIADGAKAAKPTDPTKTGFTFTGWFAAGSTTAWDFGTAITADVALKAKWTAITHSVMFDADGGMPEPATQTIDNGAKATQPADPAKAGFVFDGWFAAGSTTAWDFGTAVTSDLALTAHWADPSHTVTFDANGGAPTPPQQTIIHGATATKPADPTMSGFYFAGWYAQGAASPWNFGKPVTSDLALTARWASSSHTVTFNANGGSPEPAPQTVGDGGIVSKPHDPAKAGHTFIGWFAQGATTPWNFSTPVTSNLVLSAHWTGILHTVAFDTKGGTPTPPQQTVSDGASALEPPAPTRAGFSFKGWYAQGTTTTWDFSTPLYADLTLEARWERVIPVDPSDEPDEPADNGDDDKPNSGGNAGQKTPKDLLTGTFGTKTGDQTVLLLLLIASFCTLSFGAILLALSRRRKQQEPRTNHFNNN